MNIFNRSLSVSFILLVAALLASLPAQTDKTALHVGPQPDGSILVPSNQLLRPAGFLVNFPGRPVDIALTPDRKFLLVKNRSTIDLIRINDRMVMQSLPLVKASCSFTGLVLSQDGKRVFVSDAGSQVHVAEFDENHILHWIRRIKMPAPTIGGSPLPGGMALDEEGKTLLVTLNRNNSLGMVNLVNDKVTEIPTGIAPFDVVMLSEKKAYVSNWGGRIPKEGESTFITSGSKVLVDPRTGVANNGTVSVIDLSTGQWIRDIEVGLHPSGMVMSPDKHRLYVACANSDVVSVIDTHMDQVVAEISVHENTGQPFGSAPNALDISNDGNTLYVANGTDNAICVIDIRATPRVTGYIPTGWYPGSVVSDPVDNLLFVANVKGIGSRNQLVSRDGLNSHDHSGSVSIIPVPGDNKLREMTATVKRNNSQVSEITAQTTGMLRKFKHVIYIIKENRTYDQVFGDMTQGNGDPELVHFGREVTPNHHKLAEDFVLLDNFYCSGVLSADGHQWTDEAYVTDYLEKFFGGFTRSYPYDGNDALAYASSGFIWDNVLRNGLTFRDYGEFVDAVIDPAKSSFTDIYDDFIKGTGKIRITARPNLEQLGPYICPTFIGFPNTVSDAYRASEFIRELNDFEKKGDLPNFIIMLLPNDHTSGTTPGMQTPEAAVADNDLALGRIVEAVSHSSFWKETCILVTEDDPQAGLDHVDGHRTVGLVISPYTKRNQVVSTYYSQINMVRTIEDILGLPPMNQLDLEAVPMSDCFNSQPDFTPYQAVPSNIPIDKINPPLTGLRGKQRYWAKMSMKQDLDDVDRIDEDVFNRILWHAVKGYDVPYPVLTKKDPD